MSVTLMSEALDEAECRRLLAEEEVGRVGFVDDDAFPVVLPVNFVIDGDLVALRTDMGTKLDHVPLHRVAFEVDSIDNRTRTGWSVLVQGYGQDVTDAVGDRYEDLRRRSLPSWAPGPKTHWLTIQIHRVSGRRIVTSPAT
jgi:nitroimidazol reductase NimA-like FMN-containing flavoprotein (pyridoxamine 5'-phosphate oxidase superfamily)